MSDAPAAAEAPDGELPTDKEEDPDGAEVPDGLHAFDGAEARDGLKESDGAEARDGLEDSGRAEARDGLGDPEEAEDPDGATAPDEVEGPEGPEGGVAPGLALPGACWLPSRRGRISCTGARIPVFVCPRAPVTIRQRERSDPDPDLARRFQCRCAAVSHRLPGHLKE